MALSYRKRIAMLVFLSLVTTATASASLCPPLCILAGWNDCVRGQRMMGMTTTCILCQDADVIVTDAPVPAEPCVIGVAPRLAIRGHPFGLLSAKKLSAFDHSVVENLVLVEGGIVDVEGGTFSGFWHLKSLGLDYNRLTRVKRSWFAGLTELIQLRLTHNRITEIDSGCFKDLTNLLMLRLEGNHLQHIDPAWFHGLNTLTELNLEENKIRHLPPGVFHSMPLHHLLLKGNHLSCLVRETLWQTEDYSMFTLGGNNLMTISDEVPQGMKWSLEVYHDIIWLGVHAFSFIVMTYQGILERRLEWKYHPAGPMDIWGIEESTISVPPPFVVVLTDGELAKKATDRCRQVWERNMGVNVDLKGNSSFQLVSLGAGNTSVAMVLFNPQDKQDTNTASGTDSGILNNSSYTGTAHINTKNITCVLIYTHDPPLLFTITVDPRKPPPPCPGSNAYLHVVSVPTSKPQTPPNTTEGYRSENQTTMASMSPPQARTLRTNPEQGSSESQGVLRPIVIYIGVVVGIVFVLILVPIGCLLKGRQKGAEVTVASHGPVSCRTLPAGLCTVSYSPHSYSVIPDHLAAAQRPLPALPHTYAEIPDHIALAQRPLPHIYGEIADNVHAKSARKKTFTLPTRRREQLDVKVSCWSLPSSLHATRTADHDSLDDDTITPYAAAAEPSLPTVTKARQNKRMYDRNDDHSTADRLLAMYARPREVRHHSCVTTYGIPDTYWQWKGTRYTPRRASLPLVRLPNTYWPWVMPEEGTQNTPRRASLPIDTPPNTYWPWEMPEEGTQNTPRRASLPIDTPPNTYWPWVLPEEGTQNTPRRASLPIDTPPNTYWSWVMPEEGTQNTPRRASLPIDTPPNTYWSWVMPEEGTQNTPRRASLPIDTPPNTYWPWEISGSKGREPVTQRK
ncbi:uncharacterized protein LOC118415650 [Branchiostoma floridae]|uniref:Uncharacterized protein LOC118415650 n=1 Tax=Branchiostoma floridae TaxID=7739 RepID=A0A9J7L4M5_BRAFL|nr:uncharacterized protein LOC118415650 [Branchiostoma floridae]